MARLQVLALTVLCMGLMVSPSTGGFVRADGKKDLAAVCACLRKDGRFTTWLKLFESSGAPLGPCPCPCPLAPAPAPAP